MASQRAVAMRRADVTARLDALKKQIAERFGTTVEDQPVTNADGELAQVQRLENVAALLEAALQVEAPAPATETQGGGEVTVSETAPDAEEDSAMSQPDDGEAFALQLIDVVGPTAAAALQEAGYADAASIAAASDEELDAVPHVGPASVDKLREAFAE